MWCLQFFMQNLQIKHTHTQYRPRRRKKPSVGLQSMEGSQAGFSRQACDVSHLSFRWMALAAEWRVDGRRVVAVGSKLQLPRSQRSQRAWWQPWTLISGKPSFAGPGEHGPAGCQRNHGERREGTVAFPFIPKATRPILSSPTLGQEDHRSIGQMWPQAIPKGHRNN